MDATRTLATTIGGVVLTVVASGSAVATPESTPTESTPTERGRTPSLTYEITELAPAPGGTSSAANSLTDNGWAAGMTDLASEGVVHATLWRHGSARDLGTLGGPNSAVLWPSKNTRGLVVGVAETGAVDPRGEQWSCSAFFPSVTGHVCRGFVWEDGRMRALPTFGGTHGFATGVNRAGEVVGWAETPKEDPTCQGRDQELRFVAALWDTRRGDRIRKLKPLPRVDSASAATAINDRGHVVGISGSCDQAVGRFSARAAVLWLPGRSRPIDLGNLGDEAWNTPMSINERGVVVGFANAADAADGVPDLRPFGWTRWTGMHDLGTLAGDPNGQALGVNDDGLIVGFSQAAPDAREHRDHAVLWRHGRIADLNDLAPGYDGHLEYAADVNDRGEITGRAISADGQPVAYVATPLDDSCG